MEDEEFVDPQKKAKYTDNTKEKDEDLESEQSLSDTSDADEVSYNNPMPYIWVTTSHLAQVGDIEELLSVKYPVYFNYAFIHPSQAPKSLKVTMLS